MISMVSGKKSMVTFYQTDNPWRYARDGDTWFDTQTLGFAVFKDNVWKNIKNTVSSYPIIHYNGINNSDINKYIVNNADTPPTVDNSTYLVVNNTVNRSTHEMAILPTNTWNGNYWTHISEFSNNRPILQRSLTLQGQTPNYGNTVIQTSGNSVGFHLNTFGVTLPTVYTACSLQYFVGFPNGKSVWANVNEKLCVECEVKIATSYSEGGVNQAMFTMQFFNSLGQHVWVNVALYDSRPDWSIVDLIHWDSQDTNTAIVISHAQTQGVSNPNIKYTSALNEREDTLLAFAKGNAPCVKGWYGFSMSRTQFQTAINDVNSTFGLSYDTNPSNWKLGLCLVGPEINTVYGNGHIGMSLSNFNVFNLPV